jgi:methyltransferase
MNYAVLAYVIVERLLELVIANRNTKQLLARGGREAGREHYPFMIALHVSWLAAIVLWVIWIDPPLHPVFFLLFALTQGLRMWTMMSLGPYWTTRIITLPRAPLVSAGPYKFMRHPNYVVVVLEIALLPLALSAWHIAAVFSVLNAAMLWVRIRAENAALSSRR